MNFYQIFLSCRWRAKEKKFLGVLISNFKTYTRYSWVEEKNKKKSRKNNLVEGGNSLFSFFKGGNLKKKMGNSGLNKNDNNILDSCNIGKPKVNNNHHNNSIYKTYNRPKTRSISKSVIKSKKKQLYLIIYVLPITKK